MLTPERYDRAQRDTEYVQQLLHDFDANMNSRETESLLNELTEQNVDQESPSLFIWNEACILLLLTLYTNNFTSFWSRNTVTPDD